MVVCHVKNVPNFASYCQYLRLLWSETYSTYSYLCSMSRLTWSATWYRQMQSNAYLWLAVRWRCNPQHKNIFGWIFNSKLLEGIRNLWLIRIPKEEHYISLMRYGWTNYWYCIDHVLLNWVESMSNLICCFSSVAASASPTPHSNYHYCVLVETCP